MDRWLVILIFAAFTYVPTYSYGQDGGGGNGAYRPKPPEWQPGEMNSRMGGKIEAELKPRSWFCGFVRDCKFDLHYFFGDHYDGPAPRKSDYNKTKPWILFISGGPGEIVHREEPYFWYMDGQDKVNSVYFDVRGTGFSVIPESNDYDQFLRAEYVVEDIETLRKTLLNECDFPGQSNCKTGVTPWDAIYATSWGTIVAQQYAARYRNNVSKLILAAPVSRGHHNTDEARRKMIVDNLLDIFDKHRTKECLWDRNDPVKQPLSVFSDLTGVENFCFLTDNQKSIIRDEFVKLLNSIETKYGSVNFVASFYKQFRNDTDFREEYPYPKEFFDAIRQLEDFGAGELAGLSFDATIKQRKMSAAMYLAYYLWLPKKALTDTSDPLYPGDVEFSLTGPRCKAQADFFSALEDNILKENFCRRIVAAYFDLRAFSRAPSFNHSARARTVFSVNDGLAQWIFEIMKRERRVDHQGCFAGREIQNIARGDSQLQAVVINNTVIKEQAGRLGISATDRPCPWDPARVNGSGECENCHDVDTLILKGGADAITAGDQAEYLFEKALLDRTKRALIEFPGVGHAMNFQVKTRNQEPDEFAKVISDFEAAVIGTKMENDTAHKALLEKLKERRDLEKRIQKQASIPGIINVNLQELILGFVTSKTVRDFTQNEKARTGIETLGGCLRTEDNEKFSECICKLTKDKNPICKTLTKK